jgi:RNA polymerase sigma-70 factor (ECF subfamily)
VATSADSDSSSKIQLELPFVSMRAKGSDIRALLNDEDVRNWIAHLWDQHQVLLMELAHYELRDWDLAQEVVQDTWVDFLKSLRRFEGRCSAKTWLVQILKRCIQKEQRRLMLSRMRSVLTGGREARTDRNESRDIAQAQQDPEQRLLIEERLEHIMRAGRVLPKRQAEVWMLRDVSQWTSEEVSAALGITSENQRVLLHRARQRLRQELENCFGKTERSVQHHNDLQRS